MVNVQGKFNTMGKKGIWTCGVSLVVLNPYSTIYFIYEYVSLESKLYSTLLNLLLGRLHFHPPFYHHMVMDPSSTVGHFPEFLGPHQWPHSFSLAKV